jgi:serine/threonine-protein kinase
MPVRPDDTPTMPVPGATGEVAPGEEAEEELAPGARAGAWEIVRTLARGGHGAVYLAQRREDGRRAAVKVLYRRHAASAEMAGRFLREGRILSRLRHPGVVEILEIGLLADGRPFCAMELLEGKTLLALLATRGRLAPSEALRLIAPVCAALDAAHGEGVVHRDVKAGNVFVVTGDPPQVKLLDFGVARGAGPDDSGLTAVGERIGSAHAMAPELIRGGPVDGRADVYALGVLLYQVLTGALPFWSEDPDELERLHLAAPPPRAGRLAPVPPSVDAVIERALAKRPEDRLPSAGALLDALREAVEQAPAEDRPVRAMALHLAIVPAGPLEDERALALAEVEEEAARLVAAAGFELDVAAPGALLATRVLPEAPGPAGEERARAVAFGRDLRGRLARAAGPDARVQVCLHAGEIRVDAAGRRTGGALFRTAQWVHETPDGFSATPDATG